MRLQSLVYCFALMTASPAFALEAACEPILKASETRMTQSAWHSINEINGTMRIEFIKANGQFFKGGDGKWEKFPLNLDESERKLNARVRAGEVKLTQCKDLGSDTVDGVAVTVISSRQEMPGAPASESKLYIGKADGLPYRQVGDSVKVIYQYKGVVAPKL